MALKEKSSWTLRAEFVLLLVIQIAALVNFTMSLLPTSADAHPGGLAADGCHSDRKNGGRHCHRGAQATKPTRIARGEVYYANCAAARAAGAAPVRRGHLGYGSHLDRDHDGIGCE